MLSTSNEPRSAITSSQWPPRTVKDQSLLLDLYARRAISSDSAPPFVVEPLNDTSSRISSASVDIPQSQSAATRTQRTARSTLLDPSYSRLRAEHLLEYIFTAEPVGGIEKWWKRMTSGSRDNVRPARGRCVTGKEK